MRFIDEVRLTASSGDGGDGAALFRKEKFVPRGGPNGGDGGRGGHVVFVADRNLNTLHHLRFTPIIKAKRGNPGSNNNKTGRGGENKVIPVPIGTTITDVATGELITELTEDGVEMVVLEGGAGGRGNARFATSRNRAPIRAEPGGAGTTAELQLELKLLADVGLLGFPNAGKSTLVSHVSAAKPRVADYPFTTLVPSLGVVDMGFHGTFTVADIPGLIEGASDGTGLGHRFLRHVSRTRLLLHLVSASEHDEGHVHAGDPETPDPLRRYRAIRRELEAYDPDLSARDEIVILTKSDITPEDRLDELLDAFEEETGTRPLVISAPTKEGLSPLKQACWSRIQATVDSCEED